jgi:2-keto-3-deoxy-L-rhamnonate aldolase RhmA
LLYDRAVIARHLELGFRFIGLGSDLGFVAAGARGMVEAARGG